MTSGYRLLPMALLALSLVSPVHAQEPAPPPTPVTNDDTYPFLPALPPRPQPGKEVIDATLQEAVDLLKQGEIEAALGKASSVLRVDPANLNGYIVRGNIYIYRKDWNLARTDYESALKIDPGNFMAKFNLTEIKFRLKQYDEARAGFVDLKSDPIYSDFVAYRIFLCDLLAGHEGLTVEELAAFDKAGENPSYYFSNVAWSIYYHEPDQARDWMASANKIYSARKISLYESSLRDLGYLPLPPSTP